VNYDVRIKETGCPVLEYGDFVPATYAQFIEQKIFAALMNMDPSIVSGIQITKQEELISNIKGYLYTYFAGDLDVDPNSIDVTITVLPGSERLQMEMTYSGKSPTGEPFEFAGELKYAMDAGALTSADFEPGWLSESEVDHQKDVLFPVRIREVTDRIELPMEPFRDISAHLEYSESIALSDVNKTLPVYLILASDISRAGELLTGTFSIPVYSGRMKFPISQYIPNYSRRETILDSYAITNSTIQDYSVISEYGEPVILVDRQSSGLIEGTVVLRRAAQVTTQFVVEQPMVTMPLFPLRRRRGKYFAVFPKTVQIGDYFIKYKALSEVL